MVRLRTIINTLFFDYAHSRKVLLESTFSKNESLIQKKEIEDIDKKCKAILNSSSCTADVLSNNRRLITISQKDFIKLTRKKEAEDETNRTLVYRIDKVGDGYTISTGLYCGVINLGDKLPQIEITIGYSSLFFRHILMYCCGIYVDDYTQKDTEKDKSPYSLMVQTLFLMYLRKLARRTIPQKYVYPKERGYNIKGNVDINAFINYDLVSGDKKVTYAFPVRTEAQNIIDVLHIAIKACRIEENASDLPDIGSLKNYLSEHYSGRRPSKAIINNIHKDRCLLNGLYSDFRTPLEYAQILLNSEDLISGGKSENAGISGFLADASFLWEMYLYNLMRLRLDDWDIESQSNIRFYEDTFFAKTNYPDFVLRNRKTGDIYVLDAKFKRMTFQGIDVDNKDVQQVHSYSYYFNLQEGEKFKGAALIYPTKEDRPDGKAFESSLQDKKFAILSVKDPGEDGDVSASESAFIEELKAFLGE